MKLTKAQIEILEKVYTSTDPVVVKGIYRRTAESLTRKGLITFEYLPEKKINRVPTRLKLSKKANPQRVSRILEAQNETKSPC